ncbi:hypothetical protein M3148_15515 [Georgenia satyanarayanai]|uniref:hypothetical protein n=1 Tax=Georgenia satyanarayanai TaxID=860221 RepID=UPI002040CEA5|nr:hypothetical protein [Georgenia satyanarayanai]MCM3662388.1 hypothetical protein [Georgenia satyanarayanai]
MEKALYRLSRGTCYFPDCPRRIIEVVEGEPMVAVDIAHIYGANPGSARYDASMTDEERRAFGNLILLCGPHHKLVDGRRRHEFPADLLEHWKRDNEPPDGIEALASAGLTDEMLDTVMEQIVAQVSPRREVEVDLDPGLVMSPTDIAAMGTMAGMGKILEVNPHLTEQPKVLIANIRNTGTLPVSVEGVDLWVVIGEVEKDGSAFTLMGRNDFGHSNPRLPHRLEDGDAVRWLTKLETVGGIMQVARAAGFTVLGVRAVARLGTGEKVESDLMVWVDLA